MKQHITVEQLNELSDKGKEKLRRWWKPRLGDKFICPLRSPKVELFPGESYLPLNSDVLNDKRTLPLLLIGQLIEYLYDHRSNKTYKTIEIPIEVDCWECGRGGIKPDIFCDKLWKAVKSLLEDKA